MIVCDLGVEYNYRFKGHVQNSQEGDEHLKQLLSIYFCFIISRRGRKAPDINVNVPFYAKKYEC